VIYVQGKGVVVVEEGHVKLSNEVFVRDKQSQSEVGRVSGPSAWSL